MFVICSDLCMGNNVYIIIFCPIVEITSTLGEGTFGKVVCCKDR